MALSFWFFMLFICWLLNLVGFKVVMPLFIYLRSFSSFNTGSLDVRLVDTLLVMFLNYMFLFSKW